MENLQLTTAVPVATQLKQKISGLEPTWSAETMEGLGYLSVVEYLSSMHEEALGSAPSTAGVGHGSTCLES